MDIYDCPGGINQAFDQREAEAALAASTGSADSLVAAIEGNLEGMAHGDLVLTCQMLERGRTAWRKDAEALKAALENVLASATPNATEHPKMFAAWEMARAVLNPPNGDIRHAGPDA